jgi:ketosteroid isomerase-like protein
MLVLPSSLAAGNQQTDTPEAILHAVIRANSEKNLDVLERYVAKDREVVVYSIGGRKYVGWDEIARAMQEEFIAAERLEVSITELKVWTHGDVAWFSMELNYKRFEGNGQGQKAMLIPLRDTGVLERRQGRWVLVNWHESLQEPGLNQATASDRLDTPMAGSMDLSGEWEIQEEDKSYRAYFDSQGNGTYTWQDGRMTTTGFDGEHWIGTWEQPGNDRDGKFEVVVSKDRTEASGRWWYTRVGERAKIPPGIGGKYHWKRLSPVSGPRQAAR